MAQLAYDNAYANEASLHSRVRWGAVFAGVIAGMITQVLLSLLGIAIGFHALDPAAANYDYTAFGVGTVIWLFVSAIIAGFVGGWVAATLANIVYRIDGVMHGILSWGVFMVIAIYLMGTGLGNVVGGVFNMTASALTGATQGVAISATQQDEGVAMIREQIQDINQRINRQMAQAGPEQQAPVQQEEGMPGEEAADTAAATTWTTFFMALLSLAASAFGGVAGLKLRADYRQPTAVT